MAREPKHEAYMREALALAERALGRTSPNPMVGAVLVKDDEVVGRGFHPKAGDPHAEILALREAGERARGATLYLTLEPCAHFGRTPPCAPAVANAGVQQVFAAMSDPDSKVSGKGIHYLRERGIDVRVGLLEDEARSLNEAFVKHRTTGLPFMEIKVAMTLDGKIATRAGASRWITGEPAREWVHRRRDRADAILVGANTVRTDDPQLTVRLPHHDGKQPIRAVVTGSGKLNPHASMFRGEGRAIIFCPVDEPLSPLAHFKRSGIELVPLPAVNGKVDVKQMARWLGNHGILDVLVEGGGVLNAALLGAELVDRISAFIAPKLFGGREAPTAFSDLNVDEPAQAVRITDVTLSAIGDDWLFQGRPVSGEAKTCSRV